jgi:hypothetical protein
VYFCLYIGGPASESSWKIRAQYLTGDDPEQQLLIAVSRPVSPLNGFVNKHAILLYPTDKLHPCLQGGNLLSSNKPLL